MNNKVKLLAASALASGLLLSATPALADNGNTGRESGNGLHLGAFLNLPLAHAGVTVGSFKDNDEHKFATTTGTTTGFVKPFPFASSTAEIGTVGSVNGANVTLAPAINLSGGGTAATVVVTNASTTFKGGATSTASLASGENIVVVGTTSTSSPNTITASIVIALKNAWHFCTHLFSR